MKKAMLLLLVFTIFLTGCSISEKGEDLTGFVSKMNTLNESYDMKAKGFIFEEKSNRIYKFFIVNDTELLLSFTADNKGRLESMSITTSILIQDEAVLTFIKNAIFSFVDNNEIYNEITEAEHFKNALNEISKETTKIKSGNAELLLDVTTLGTVITVHKDI
jgi:hypothetical protein